MNPFRSAHDFRPSRVSNNCKLKNPDWILKESSAYAMSLVLCASLQSSEAVLCLCSSDTKASETKNRQVRHSLWQMPDAASSKTCS